MSGTEIIEAISSIAGTVAIAVGGGWTYLRFARGRTSVAKATMEHGAVTTLRGSHWIYCRLPVTVTNNGTVAIDPDRTLASAHRVALDGQEPGFVVSKGAQAGFDSGISAARRRTGAR